MSTATSFGPVSAVGGAPLKLAMQRLWLTGRLLPAGGRLTVQHVFRSEEQKPLEVIYSFPLPRDAALRAFRIKGECFEAHSELKPVEDAVREYERGIADGSLATLARQYGDGVVNLTAGNIRPGETVTVFLDLVAGVELRDNGFRFRFPFTLAPAYHPRMKAACTVDGVGEVELPTAEFGDVILPSYHADASSLHEVGFELSVPQQQGIEEVASPSHAIRVKYDTTGPASIALAPDHDVPDRDLVLDVSYREVAPRVFAGASESGRRPFAALVPSTAFGTNTNAARSVVILLDRSGSMQGVPLQQARKAIEACLASLSVEDRFALVAFDDEVENMHDAMLPGTRENRSRASAFLAQVDARGSTELAKGFEAAAGILGGRGDILILTDGQVAGTEQILARARAVGIRLSCLGIGAASEDRFLALLARETGGLSRFVTPEERVVLAAVDLFASVGRPLASGLTTNAGISPEPSATVFAGTPVLLFGEAAGTDASIELTWDGGGRLSLPVPEGDGATGQTLRLLQGARLITDWESRYPAEEALAPIEKRKQSRVAERLRELSETYGLQSREMSLVAVVARAGDRPGELPETRVVPVGMPRDIQFGAYFGGAPGGANRTLVPAPAPMMAVASTAVPMSASGIFRQGQSLLRKVLSVYQPEGAPAPMQSESTEDVLLELACLFEPDGGMPGDTPGRRAARSVAAVFAFVSQGHTLGAGAFRSHVARLVAFLESLGGLAEKEQAAVERAVRVAGSGKAPAGDWMVIARRGVVEWGEVVRAV